MMLYRAIQFLWHMLRAKHTGGFGVHSPFIYDFIKNVVETKHPSYAFEPIENIRKELQHNHTTIVSRDFGANKNKQRTLSNITRNTLKSAREAQLLFRTIERYKCRNITELGTSLGLTTLYLASSSKHICCTSFEGCDQLALWAENNAKKLQLTNIHIVIGSIDNTLTPTLERLPPQDFVFMDAHHEYEASIKYFKTILNFCHENSIIVFDDIYWSKDMTRAWKAIQNEPAVRATVNLFHMGFIFLNPELHRQHYRIYF